MQQAAAKAAAAVEEITVPASDVNGWNAPMPLERATTPKTRGLKLPFEAWRKNSHADFPAS